MITFFHSDKSNILKDTYYIILNITCKLYYNWYLKPQCGSMELLRSINMLI